MVANILTKILTKYCMYIFSLFSYFSIAPIYICHLSTSNKITRQKHAWPLPANHMFFVIIFNFLKFKILFCFVFFCLVYVGFEMPITCLFCPVLFSFFSMIRLENTKCCNIKVLFSC